MTLEMTKVLIVILSLLFISGCIYAQEALTPINVTLKLCKGYEIRHERRYFKQDIEKYNYEIVADSANEKRFDVEISIKNNSEKAILIWVMSCSWEDNLLVNNDYMRIRGRDCDKNYPKQIKIKGGDSVTYMTTLVKSIKFDYPAKYAIYGKQVETTKLGFIVINGLNSETDTNYEIAMKDKSKWTIFWSNPLYLLEPDEANPKPVIIPVYEPKK